MAAKVLIFSNIFDLLGYILQKKYKKVTKTSILATQVYDTNSLGGGKFHFTLIYRNDYYHTLWELYGIKFTR